MLTKLIRYSVKSIQNNLAFSIRNFRRYSVPQQEQTDTTVKDEKKVEEDRQEIIKSQQQQAKLKILQQKFPYKFNRKELNQNYPKLQELTPFVKTSLSDSYPNFLKAIAEKNRFMLQRHCSKELEESFMKSQLSTEFINHPNSFDFKLKSFNVAYLLSKQEVLKGNIKNIMNLDQFKMKIYLTSNPPSFNSDIQKLKNYLSCEVAVKSKSKLIHKYDTSSNQDSQTHTLSLESQLGFQITPDNIMKIFQIAQMASKRSKENIVPIMKSVMEVTFGYNINWKITNIDDFLPPKNK